MVSGPVTFKVKGPYNFTGDHEFTRNEYILVFAILKRTRLGRKINLTNKLIDELSIYYSIAIHSNHDSIEKSVMRSTQH